MTVNLIYRLVSEIVIFRESVVKKKYKKQCSCKHVYMPVRYWPSPKVSASFKMFCFYICFLSQRSVLDLQWHSQCASFSLQLIPSPSSLLQANWPTRPCPYRSFPSAADLRRLRFWQLQSGFAGGKKKEMDLSRGGQTPRTCVFKVPLDFVAVRPQRWTLDKDNRLPWLQDNPTSVPFEIRRETFCSFHSFVLWLEHKSTESGCELSFSFGQCYIETSLSLVSVLSTFASLPLFVVVFLFWKMKRLIYCEEKHVFFFKSTFKCVWIIKWLYIVNILPWFTEKDASEPWKS